MTTTDYRAWADINEWLDILAAQLRENAEYRPTEIISSWGTHGMWYSTDEDGDDYATVGFCIANNNVFAEIEDGTYGNLQGFRIYLGTRTEWEDEDVPPGITVDTISPMDLMDRSPVLRNETSPE